MRRKIKFPTVYRTMYLPKWKFWIQLYPNSKEICCYKECHYKEFSMYNTFFFLLYTVNVLKFRTLVACQKGIDKQCRPRSDCFWRSSLIRVFSVCYSDKHFVNSSPENQLFIWKQKEKRVQYFRTFTVTLNFRFLFFNKITKVSEYAEIQCHLITSLCHIIYVS